MSYICKWSLSTGRAKESLEFDGSHRMAYTDVNIALRCQHLPPFFLLLVTLYKNADYAFSLALKIS